MCVEGGADLASGLAFLVLLSADPQLLGSLSPTLLLHTHTHTHTHTHSYNTHQHKAIRHTLQRVPVKAVCVKSRLTILALRAISSSSSFFLPSK